MEEVHFNKELHIKYWQRCLKLLLPQHYTATDSSRMTLGFFILSALDLLGQGPQTLPIAERSRIRDWILKCQHPNGGFCGSPNHKFPDYYYECSSDGSTREIDSANLPATYFAILSLGLVGDLRRINRIKCLRWLRSLQREDGSFGELITPEGKIWGGRDMRYCYVAVASRWMLRGDGENFQEDIDVEKLVQHIKSSQTYDGGISESSQHEAHAGYTYCAIATLSFLNRLPSLTSSPTDCKYGISNISQTIRWLVSRQTRDEKEDDGQEKAGTNILEAPLCQTKKDDSLPEKKEYVGFNGRCNKQMDTCYTFWVTASLNLLYAEDINLVDHLSARRFLVEKTQYATGGFGKCPGDPPDIYHSYLGLAALAVNKEPGIKPLDPALCVSVEQRKLIANLRNHLLVPTRIYWKYGYCFSIREDDPEFDKINDTWKP